MPSPLHQYRRPLHITDRTSMHDIGTVAALSAHVRCQGRLGLEGRPAGGGALRSAADDDVGCSVAVGDLFVAPVALEHYFVEHLPLKATQLSIADILRPAHRTVILTLFPGINAVPTKDILTFLISTFPRLLNNLLTNPTLEELV